MSQFISLQQAIDMTTLYRKEKENILSPEYKNKNILCRSETFNRDVFDSVLAQEGCRGLRIYYGMDESLQVHAIVVGVNEKNEDMLPAAALATEDDNPGIIENGARCPEECPEESPLNP